jgi:hypothetical protein
MGEHLDRWNALGTVAPTRVNDWGVGVSTGLDTVGGGSGPIIPLWSNSEFSTVTTASRAMPATNAMIWVAITVASAGSITGVRFRKGAGTTTANVRVALYNQAGARIADRTTNFAIGTTASVAFTVPFDAPVDVTPGIYWVGIIGSSTSADFWGWNTTNEYFGPAHNATQGTFVTPASFTPPALSALHTATVKPWLQLY